MVHIDMTNDGSKDFLTGINLWEVVGCFEKTSTKGDPMLVVTFMCGAAKLQDNIMLAGPAWARMGRPKLFALGLPPNMTGELDPLSLIGREVWIATVVEQKPYTDPKTGQEREGLPRLVVDIKQLSHAGYQFQGNVPPGANVPDPADTPF